MNFKHKYIGRKHEKTKYRKNITWKREKKNRWIRLSTKGKIECNASEESIMLAAKLKTESSYWNHDEYVFSLFL